MKHKNILIIMIITIFFTGCSASKEDTLINEGKLALEKHDYTKAQDLLSQVLTIDSTDENARSMYIQAVKMKDSAEYEEKRNYDKSIECLEVIENLKGGSSQIKSEASQKKKELIKLNEEYKKAQEERKENAKDISGQGKYKLEQDAIKENQKQEAIKEEEEQKTQEEENNQQNNQSGNTQDDDTQENTNGTTQTPNNQSSQQNQQPQQQPQV
nr:hypothetical protein [uncultured Romboutsia sp.]